MKIVHILGRGIEGCGVTRFTLELKDWALSQGWNYTVYAPTDKKWTRASSHYLDENIKQWKWGNKPARGDTQCGTESIVEDCNKSDLVLIGSLPSKGHPDDCIENFGELVKGIKTKKVMIQHDHKMMSIRRNALLDDVIQSADVILSYSTKSPFMDYCKKIGAKGNMFNFCNGVNVQRIREQYWKPIEEQDPDHLKWIGRSAYWKGFDVLFDLYKSTKGTDLLYTLEGMEKSIQFVDIRKAFDFHEMAEEFDVELDMQDVRIERTTSTGPGGQSVNTTYSAIKLHHEPSGIIVSCQDQKSQNKNIEKALKVLRTRLYEHELKKK